MHPSVQVQREVVLPETDFSGEQKSRQWGVSEGNDGVARLSPFERVRWVEGIHTDGRRIQRATASTQTNPLSDAPGASAYARQIVQPLFFEVLNGRLTAEAELVRTNFSADAERYVVEFLFQGELDPITSLDMTEIWNVLSSSFHERGLDNRRILMGGAQYRQPRNGILLIKIGTKS